MQHIDNTDRQQTTRETENRKGQTSDKNELVIITLRQNEQFQLYNGENQLHIRG